MLTNVSFRSKVTRNRFLLLGRNGYFTDDNGAILQTTNPEEATAFVDVGIAAQRGQALIDQGYEVLAVKPYAFS